MKTLVLVLALAAPLLAAPPSSGGNPDRGLPLFEAYCAGCHGFEGRGDGPMAPALERETGVRPMDLSDPAFQGRLSDEQLSKLIREGGDTHRTGYMPAWGLTLSQPQLTDLVAYIRELRDPDRAATARAFNLQQVLDRGRILYGLRCLACHGDEGKGDGPFMKSADLTSGILQDKSDTQLNDLIASGLEHAHVKSGWWERPLDLQELAALVFYLRALPLQKTP